MLKLPSCTGFRFVQMVWPPFCFSSCRFDTVSTIHSFRKYTIYSFWKQLCESFFFLLVFFYHLLKSIIHFENFVLNKFSIYLKLVQCKCVCVDVDVCVIFILFSFLNLGVEKKVFQIKRTEYFACQFPIKQAFSISS